MWHPVRFHWNFSSNFHAETECLQGLFSCTYWHHFCFHVHHPLTSGVLKINTNRLCLIFLSLMTWLSLQQHRWLLLFCWSCIDDNPWFRHDKSYSPLFVRRWRNLTIKPCSCLDDNFAIPGLVLITFTVPGFVLMTFIVSGLPAKMT